ncbi:hypothetical protein [Burkholderia catarinensis]|uniref:hypothetical protein n=1 Tax=Burkholderia catarinensis TaxID=1108140 RepID=UPI000913D72E|nr:hypothetical protein [Burkholderia catarinensis]KAG8149419.1 hypothetical protein BFF94_032930 [Burkholderia catarinensis]
MLSIAGVIGAVFARMLMTTFSFVSAEIVAIDARVAAACHSDRRDGECVDPARTVTPGPDRGGISEPVERATTPGEQFPDRNEWCRAEVPRLPSG